MLVLIEIEKPAMKLAFDGIELWITRVQPLHIRMEQEHMRLSCLAPIWTLQLIDPTVLTFIPACKLLIFIRSFLYISYRRKVKHRF